MTPPFETGSEHLLTQKAQPGPLPASGRCIVVLFVGIAMLHLVGTSLRNKLSGPPDDHPRDAPAPVMRSIFQLKVKTSNT
jgi:hypothetical protein